MGNIADGGRTVLFVSHNLAAIEALCDRVLVLERGQLVFDGPTDEALSRYLADQDESGAQPLHERVDRRGSGTVRAAAIDVLDADGRSTRVFRMGDDIVLRLRMQGECHAPIIALHVMDKSNALVVALASHEQLATPMAVAGDSTVECRLQQIPLMHGNYFVNVLIAYGPPGSVELFDYVERTVSFHVESADVYGSGRPPDARHGVIFNRALWKMITPGPSPA